MVDMTDPVFYAHTSETYMYIALRRFLYIEAILRQKEILLLQLKRHDMIYSTHSTPYMHPMLD